MTTTQSIVGSNGADGADGPVPGDGVAGSDTYGSYSGPLNDSLDYSVTGGDGGSGGDATGGMHDGGAAGGGGAGVAFVDTLIFAPPAGTFTIDVTATGGDAGAAGAGIGGGAAGAGAPGGSASAYLTNDVMTFAAAASADVTLTATANGGLGTGSVDNGNAAATLDGDSIDLSAVGTGSLHLEAAAHTLPVLSGVLPQGVAEISQNTITGASGGMQAEIVLSGTQLTLTDNTLGLGDGDDDVVITLDDEGAAAASLTFSSNVFDGGAGSNTLSLQASSNLITATIHVDLSAHSLMVNANHNTLLNIRDVTVAYLDTGSAPAVTMTGDGQDNVLTSAGGDDSLTGGGGADQLVGMDGADLLDGGTGGDALQGGVGLDTATYADATGGVSASLAAPGTNTGDAAGDSYSSIENLTGSDFADTLTGSDPSVGGAGINVLSGGAGDDVLQGMGAADVLDGGSGTDTASYSDSSASVIANLAAGGGTGDAAGDTYVSIENLTGSAFGDTLIGDGGVNALSGGDGNDSLQGMASADALNGGAGIDAASYEGASAGVVASLTTPGSNTGDAAGDSYVSIENLIGSLYKDTLTGDGGQNKLIGLDGDDLLQGMGGPDTLDGGKGNDTASYANAPGAVNASLATPATNTGDAAGDKYLSIENLTGSAFADVLTGDDNDNILTGGGAGDALSGGAGTDTASYATAATGVTANMTTPGVNTGDAAGDTYSSIENIVGSDFNDVLTGDGNHNRLTGGLGDDVLQGRAAADVLDGGSGTDAASYANAAAAVVANLTTPGSNTGEAAGDSYVSIENLIGSVFADTLIGNAGANVIIGGAGGDAMNGMGAFDTASYVTSSVGVTASLTNPGSNTGDAAGDTYASIEGLAGSSFNDKLTGDAGTNSLLGLDGDDILQGRAGADLLNGGNGIDTAAYTNAVAGVTASLSTPGTNTGEAAGDSYVSIENLSGSSFGDTLTGDGGANGIMGLDGDDVLQGRAGADVLNGGNGLDAASYSLALVGVTASLTTPGSNTGDAAGDTYTSIENLIGSNFGDTLIGNAGVNVLTGLNGDDVLEGRAGPDVLNGGAGLDSASYAHAAAGVVASLSNTAVNTGEAAGDTYSSIENLIGSGFGDILVGSNGANTLSGGNGDDFLTGRGGADALLGGLGTDTASYAGAAAAVVANMTTPGLNTGEAVGDTYSSIENLTGTSFDDTLTGDGGNNVIIGGLGADAMDGGGGIDTVDYSDATSRVYADLNNVFTAYYALGDHFTSIENLIGSVYDDLLFGDGADNVLTGRDGNDFILGLAGADTLDGGSGNDSMFGGAGVDVLLGGAGDDGLGGGPGADVLNGGAGTDVAEYDDATAGVTANLTTPALNTGDAAGDTYVSIENLYGSSYVDTLTGNALANKISGAGSNDTLNGMGGDDLLIGGAGGDAMNGGPGTDTVSYADAGAGVTVNMTTPSLNTGDALGDTFSSIELLVGSPYGDFITGDGGANHLAGGAGDDTLQGRAGADILDGGLGINTVTYKDAPVAVIANLTTPASNTGDAAGDTYISIRDLTGSAFDDTLTGDGQNNTLRGGAGNDTMYGLGGDDMLYGGAGGDALHGGTGTDTANYEDATGPVIASMTSPAGNTGFAAGDTYDSVENMISSHFNTTLIGDGANNTLGVDDSYTFYGGYNWLQGMGGDDVLLCGAYGSTLDGGDGNDTASFYWTSSNVTWDLNITGPQGSTVLINIENLSSGTGNDSLSGDAGVNILFGDDGNDVLNGRGAGDVLNGGNGLDTASYSDATAGVSASLAAPGTNTGDAAGDSYISIENLKGSGFADTLTGDANANTINGGAGDDTIFGGGGGDKLDGGAGRDHLTGSAAADKFVFDSVSDSTGPGADIITGFDFSNDKFDVPGSVTAIDAAVNTGALSLATFNTDLVADLGALGAHHAVLFTPNAGDLLGIQLLVVDENGAVGYQAGADLVIALVSPVNVSSLSTGDFI